MRKTAAQKRDELERLRSRVWEKFKRDIERAESFEDAMIIHQTPVSISSPGRSFYSNFGFFMYNFMPPHGASKYELEQYLRLLHCFDRQGILKDGALDKLVPLFEDAIEQKRLHGLY